MLAPSDAEDLSLTLLRSTCRACHRRLL